MSDKYVTRTSCDNPFQSQGIRRRQFLGMGLGVLGLALVPAVLHLSDKGRLPIPLTEPWRTLDHVLQNLLPSEQDSPGAIDFGSLEYLRHALEWPRENPEDREFILNGVGWLNGVARGQYGQDFSDLAIEDQEKTLTEISKSDAGERWLSQLLTYAIESVFSDPIYGGNKDGLGWRWLQHQPGMPRPNASNLWYKL